MAERPGQWALVAEGLDSYRAHHSVRKMLCRYGLSVNVRKMDGEGYSVWARAN